MSDTENPNYIVHIQDCKGRRAVSCETEKEVWEAIGSRAWEGLYQVESPTGLETGAFIPF